MFLLYTGMAVVENLIFLYFEFLGGSYSMCGITVAVTVLFELPLFHYAPEVLRRLKSPVWLFQFGCIAYVIRVVGYSLIPIHHPYWTLILEPLHGVTIGFVTVGCVAFAAEWVPSGYEASGQGFLSMIRGLGQFVGLCIGGFLEGRILYRILAAIVTVGSVILAISNHITTIETPTPKEEDRISSTPEKKEQSNEHGLQLVPLDDEPTILT
jgi:cyanate permease